MRTGVKDVVTQAAPLEEAFRAHRAMQLSQEAAKAPVERPSVAPEALEERPPLPSPHTTPQAAPSPPRNGRPRPVAPTRATRPTRIPKHPFEEDVVP